MLWSFCLSSFHVPYWRPPAPRLQYRRWNRGRRSPNAVSGQRIEGNIGGIPVREQALSRWETERLSGKGNIAQVRTVADLELSGIARHPAVTSGPALDRARGELEALVWRGMRALVGDIKYTFTLDLFRRFKRKADLHILGHHVVTGFCHSFLRTAAVDLDFLPQSVVEPRSFPVDCCCGAGRCPPVRYSVLAVCGRSGDASAAVFIDAGPVLLCASVLACMFCQQRHGTEP